MGALFSACEYWSENPMRFCVLVCLKYSWQLSFDIFFVAFLFAWLEHQPIHKNLVISFSFNKNVRSFLASIQFQWKAKNHYGDSETFSIDEPFSQNFLKALFKKEKKKKEKKWKKKEVTIFLSI